MSVKVGAYALVMFDLDGTLVDSVLDLHAALNLALDECGFPSTSIAQCRIWVGNGAEVLVNRALWQTLRPNENHEALPQTLAAFYRHYAVTNGQQSALYDGAASLFDQLKKQGCKLAVVTNKPAEPAKVLLKSVGLEYDLLIGGDTTQYKKPHPQPILHCLAHFDVHKQDAVLIGDSVNDFDAARAAGVDVVGVSYGYNHGLPIDASYLNGFVDSLLELG